MTAPPPPARLLGDAVIVGALGNMVDTYDLVLFSVVRVASLKDLGLTGEAVTRDGLLLNIHMLGMLVGGVLLGVASGFWVTLITLAAEQFGTNIRATVATTVPNFVRGPVIPITAAFSLLRPQLGFLNASLVDGAARFGTSLYCATRLSETFGKDLDYAEE